MAQTKERRATCLSSLSLTAFARSGSRLLFGFLPPLVADSVREPSGICAIGCSHRPDVLSPTNSVKTPKEAQTTNCNQQPGPILSSSTTRLLMEGGVASDTPALHQQCQNYQYQYHHQYQQ